MRYAEYRTADGVILNIIVVKSGEAPPAAPADRGYAADDGAAQIGGIWDGAAFLPPPAPDPARLDAELLARLEIDMTSSDMAAAVDVLAALLAGLREAIVDFDARLAPPWLAGATTEVEIAAAIVARRKALVDAGVPIKTG